jgi:hypothetical protein
MYRFLQDLRLYLPGRDWRLALDLRQPPGGGLLRGVEWIVESRTPVIGRRVQLVFRIIHFDPYYDEHDFEILVRSPDWTGEGAPEEVLGRWETEANTFRRLFRVMEWFRDPWSPFLWEDVWDGDWVPPAHWDVTRLGSFLDASDMFTRCTDVAEMLRQVRGCGLSPRKRLLLACALCRRLPLAMLHESNRQAVSVAERYAEGACPRRDLKKACKPSRLSWLCYREPFEAVEEALRALAREGGEGGWIADVIRDLAGNPFRPVSVRRQWLRNNELAVQQMAEAIAAEQAFDQLPILADALEDAGCTEASVLDHCRGPGPHVPGCWVLDLLRGKS